MKKIILTLTIMFIFLVSKSQSFTFSKMITQIPNLGTQSVDMLGELIITDTTITQTIMGVTTTTSIVKVNEYGDYKIKSGDYDIRYRFTSIPEFVKDNMKDKKGKWLDKEIQFATHILITDFVDRFTNQHTNISMYLTPKK